MLLQTKYNLWEKKRWITWNWLSGNWHCRERYVGKLISSPNSYCHHLLMLLKLKSILFLHMFTMNEILQDQTKSWLFYCNHLTVGLLVVMLRKQVLQSCLKFSWVLRDHRSSLWSLAFIFFSQSAFKTKKRIKRRLWAKETWRVYWLLFCVTLTSLFALIIVLFIIGFLTRPWFGLKIDLLLLLQMFLSYHFDLFIPFHFHT